MAHNKDKQQGFKGVSVAQQEVQRHGNTKKVISTLIIIVIIALGVTYLVTRPDSEDNLAALTADNDTTATSTEDTGGLAVDTTFSEVTLGSDTTNASTQTAAVSQAVAGYVASNQQTVQVAVLAEPPVFDYNRDDIQGCDEVVMATAVIPQTPRVLHAALNVLFDGTRNYGFNPGNFIATQEDLDFSYATINNGVARVYLTGAVGPINGVCDEPRIETQIRETALQFSTVQAVEIYLNGEPLNVN